MSSTWQPETTCHPCGRVLGPVYYEQRQNGKATGLFFVVSRTRHWQMRALNTLIYLPVIGRLVVRLRQKMTVTYRWSWLHCCPQSDA